MYAPYFMTRKVDCIVDIFTHFTILALFDTVFSPIVNTPYLMDKVDFTKLLSLDIRQPKLLNGYKHSANWLCIKTVGMFDYFSFAPNGTNDFLKVDLEVYVLCMRLLQLSRK